MSERLQFQAKRMASHVLEAAKRLKAAKGFNDLQLVSQSLDCAEAAAQDWQTEANALGKSADLAAENARLRAANAEYREALSDMLWGWKYIRRTHGDLYGVGWDRAQTKAENVLAKDSPEGATDG